jgi:hypothetical protein
MKLCNQLLTSLNGMFVCRVFDIQQKVLWCEACAAPPLAQITSEMSFPPTTLVLVSCDTCSEKLSWIALGIRGAYKTSSRGSYSNLVRSGSASYGKGNPHGDIPKCVVHEIFQSRVFF